MLKSQQWNLEACLSVHPVAQILKALTSVVEIAAGPLYQSISAYTEIYTCKGTHAKYAHML